MAVLGEIGRGTTPRFILKTVCETDKIEALELTIKSGAVTIRKTLKEYEAYTWFPYTGAIGNSTANKDVKWLPVLPTPGSALSDTPNSWIGIYSGTESAPSDVNKYSWYEYNRTGANVFFKGAAVLPTSNNNMIETTDAYIGIASTDSTTAPAAYTDYTWHRYTGAAGASVTNVQKKWLPERPMLQSDLSDTPNHFIGIFVPQSGEAPEFSAYTWYPYEGIPGFSKFVHIKWAASEPANDEVYTDTTAAWIGIQADPNEAGPILITSDQPDKHRLHVDLTQEETLALSDEITYQYHYRLAVDSESSYGFTNSSRIYRRTVRELLSGRESAL